MRGMKTCFPMWDPVIISASITLVWRLRQISLVLLQRPSERFRFRRSMIGIPTFKFNLSGENPVIFKDLKNSGKYTLLKIPIFLIYF